MGDDEQRRVLTSAAVAGLIGLMAGIARGVIVMKHGGWVPFVRGLIASVLVAVLIGWGIDDTDLSPTKAAAVIGVCAYLADDILVGLAEFARLFGADPLGFATRVWDAIRGRRT